MSTPVRPDRITTPLRPVHLTSFRWWFENRQNGDITIGQFPNWPLFAIAGAWIVRRFVDDGSPAASATGAIGTALWLFWGADELVRGVNPWRRLLGAAVIGWQVVGLVR